MSGEPDEATVKRRSENAEGALTTAGCIGIEAVGCAIPVLAVVLLPVVGLLG